MKFLIVGAGGMAGHLISIYLIEQGHQVTGFEKRQLLFCNNIIGDARNEAYVESIIKDGKFDTIINCIGILNQYAEQNKGLAVYLNSWFPHLLAELTKDTPAQVIHMSTDCVFSGKKGSYTEQDIPDGETVYDKTKALGELHDSKNITFRNSIVGPDINEKGIGLLNWFMKQNGPIKGYKNAIWTGLTTLQLAKTMEQASKERVHGLFNMVYSEPISKFDLIRLFNKYLRGEKIEIIPDEEFAVNKSLKRTNFDFDYLVPDYEQMVSEMAEWINKHKNLYPHYNL